jgi:putative transposase
MKRKRCSDEQIAFALRQAENGIKVAEVCRKLDVSELKRRRIGDVHLSPQEALKFGLVQEVQEFTVPAGNQLIQI